MLLLRAERADVLEESFKAGRGDDAHEPAGRLAEVAVGVRYPARRKNCRTLPGSEFFIANRPFVFAFEDLKRLVLAMVDMRRGPAARHVVRFDCAHHAAGIATMEADDHGNAQNVYLLAAVVGNLDWIHN